MTHHVMDASDIGVVSVKVFSCQNGTFFEYNVVGKFFD